MPMTPKQMVKLLKKNGFIKVRQRGSHALYFNLKTNKQTTVPMHAKDLGKDLKQIFLSKRGSNDLHV